jgi:formylglycine-generating enzyme required for sulfatase activity
MILKMDFKNSNSFISMENHSNNSSSAKKQINWRSVLPPTGAALVLILILLGMAAGCHRLYYRGMVHVEAGQFEMGCDEGLERERPVHKVKLDGFWIDQYEVINSQYIEFLNQGYEEGWIDTVEYVLEDGTSWFQAEKDDNRLIYLYPSKHWSHIYFEDDVFKVLDGKELLPVTVSWYGATAYCESFDKRLPTEAEWEYASKGGHLSHYTPGVTEYYRYSGSNDADEVAWHKTTHYQLLIWVVN